MKGKSCPGNYKLQFPGHHSHFRKDFQMLLAVKETPITKVITCMKIYL